MLTADFLTAVLKAKSACSSEVSGEKIPYCRTVPEWHVVANMVAAFEQQPLLGAGGLIICTLRLLYRHEIFGAVDDEQRTANFWRQSFECAVAVQFD